MIHKALIDSDVLIDYLRGFPRAIEYLENENRELYISSINVAEIYAGIRSSGELIAVKEFLAVFVIIPVDEKIAESGGLFRREYFKSHNIGLSDALIAASAETENAIVVTLNKKHYPMLKSSQLLVPYKK